MKYPLNLLYWSITIPILMLMLLYAPVFTSILLGIILVIGIIGGVLLWKYRNRHR